MAKRTGKTDKKQNGVARKRGADSEDLPELDVVDLEENSGGEEAGDTEAEASTSASPKRKTKTAARKTVAKTAAAGSRKTGRSKKAPERYENKITEPKPKKKRSGGGGGEYVVEGVRGVMLEGKKFKFLIKWENYGEKDVGWEPESNVTNCKAHIQKFLDSISRHVESLK